MPTVTVEVAAKKFALPNECPCCGAAPDTELRLAPRTQSDIEGAPRAQAFPFCRRCVAHVQKWEASGVGSAGVMVLAIAAAVVLAWQWMIVAGVAAFIAGASFAWWLRSSRRAAAKAACAESCASPGRAVEYLGWSGASNAFTFASPTFAARFAEANQPKLANVSAQLRKLLDGYKQARLAVPTPAAATGVVPPPLTARDWIARIEATEGTVARRIALQRALEMIEEPHPRRELIQTVARIELAPLLDKLQRQSSPAAKRTLLEEAIEQVRDDNIQDELQAALLEKLAARIKEL